MHSQKSLAGNGGAFIFLCYEGYLREFLFSQPGMFFLPRLIWGCLTLS